MNFLSVCSGIEAASVAWKPLGWEAVAFSEIEKFPSAVLAHHYPTVPNFGDMTKHYEWNLPSIRLVVGGTPCQAFSIAGLRKGLDDPRGNLTLTYLGVINQFRPDWMVWENVPGVLSDKSGAFGAFLGGLGQLGYGFAYRVLDAQYVRVDGIGRAVPQRRRRVFVVGYFGDWRPAAAVLFDRESLSGNPAPRRETSKEIAGTLESRARSGGVGTGASATGYLQPVGFGPDDGSIARCVTTGEHQRQDFETTTLVSYALRASASHSCDKGDGGLTQTLVAHSLLAKGNSFHAADQDTYVAHPLRAEGFDASEDGSHPTLRSMGHSTSHQNAGGHAAVAGRFGVRRLTPTECERLQGLPDGYTAIPWRGKTAENCPDGPRYKALGNSMAVNCMRWIGRRIQMVEAILQERSAA